VIKTKKDERQEGVSKKERSPENRKGEPIEGSSVERNS
jgi:hypothetical protein